VRLLRFTNEHNSWFSCISGIYLTDMEFISPGKKWGTFSHNSGIDHSPGNLQEQISHQWNLYDIIFLWNMFYQNLYHRKLFLGGTFFTGTYFGSHFHAFLTNRLYKKCIRMLRVSILSLFLRYFDLIIELFRKIVIFGFSFCY
jgi:hypothetical protein